VPRRPPRRPGGGPRRPTRAVLAWALVLLAAGQAAWAQGISYTVQVVALSDRDSALRVVGDLLREGYPAYVVRSTSAQGDVFRVRVGVFANRPAALTYADAMPEVGGGRPVPALAEAIPTGITPLAPRLLLQEDVSGVEARLLRFGSGGLALRLQWRVPLGQAEYVILREGAVERVRAWQLVEGPEGVRLRVRDMALWPDTWQQDSAEVRQGYLTNLVTLVADRLGVGAAEVMAARYVPPGDEVPRLIVVERVQAGAPDAAELLGVGLPAGGMTPAGPIAYLGLDPGTLPGVPASARIDLATRSVSGELAEATWAGFEGGAVPEDPEAPGENPAHPAPPPGGAVTGDGWTAAPDGRFVRLSVDPAGAAGGTAASWRACVGTPLWSDGRYLLALQGGVLLVYDFLPR